MAPFVVATLEQSLRLDIGPPFSLLVHDLDHAGGNDFNMLVQVFFGQFLFSHGGAASDQCDAEWLTDLSLPAIMHEPFPMDQVLQDSLYYPSSGFDGDPVRHLAGNILSFIYVDYGYSHDEFMCGLACYISVLTGLLHFRRSMSQTPPRQKPLP
jgi:hypothetical protein